MKQFNSPHHDGTERVKPHGLQSGWTAAVESTPKRAPGIAQRCLDEIARRREEFNRDFEFGECKEKPKAALPWLGKGLTPERKAEIDAIARELGGTGAVTICTPDLAISHNEIRCQRTGCAVKIEYSKAAEAKSAAPVTARAWEYGGTIRLEDRGESYTKASDTHSWYKEAFGYVSRNCAELFGYHEITNTAEVARLAKECRTALGLDAAPEWPKVLMPVNGVPVFPLLYRSENDGEWGGSRGEMRCVGSYSFNASFNNHRPGTVAEYEAWLKERVGK